MTIGRRWDLSVSGGSLLGSLKEKRLQHDYCFTFWSLDTRTWSPKSPLCFFSLLCTNSGDNLLLHSLQVFFQLGHCLSFFFSWSTSYLQLCSLEDTPKTWAKSGRGIAGCNCTGQAALDWAVDSSLVTMQWWVSDAELFSQIVSQGALPWDWLTSPPTFVFYRVITCPLYCPASSHDPMFCFIKTENPATLDPFSRGKLMEVLKQPFFP